MRCEHCDGSGWIMDGGIVVDRCVCNPKPVRLTTWAARNGWWAVPLAIAIVLMVLEVTGFAFLLPPPFHR